MAWYYSFTHKRGTEDATTWQQRIRSLYPADALFAEAGGLCVVAVAAGRDTAVDMLTHDHIHLLVKEPTAILGNARLVWFESWMLASLREVLTDIVRKESETSEVIDSLKATIAQTLRGTDRGNMS